MFSPGFAKTLSFFRAITSPSTFFKGQVGDGREKKLLDHVVEEAELGNPASVLDAIDKCAANGTWFMNIGDDKGPILDAAVQQCRPRIALELGAYCGYSAVRIASRMEPGSLLISIEMNPDNVKIARQMIEHSGLSSRVRILKGTLDKCLEEVQELLKKMNIVDGAFDLVFIDHNKNVYLDDYLLLKQEKMIHKGSVVVADNMGFPGSPSFWKYLKTHPHELQTVEHKCKFEYLNWMSDIVTISTVVAL